MMTGIAFKNQLASRLKSEAKRLGFHHCGISKAQRLDEEAQKLEQWLMEGRHATMEWMERNFEKRVDPRRLVDGARSVISVTHNYFQPVSHGKSPGTGKISRYAWGDDYHDVLKEKLFLLFDWLENEVGDVAGRAFVDSAPVMDKVWAARSGLGWIGKHTNLLSRDVGSFYFVGSLIVDVELPPDAPTNDFCGSCTRCIDACPTDAIFAPYQVDSRRCISYLTIEHRGAVDSRYHEAMGDWIFGCDICQDVCPWNKKFSRPTEEKRFEPRDGLPDTALQDWLEIDLDAFRETFRRNPVKRAKFEGFKRNVQIAVENARRSSEAVQEISGSD